jgi:hypothetical protein
MPSMPASRSSSTASGRRTRPVTRMPRPGASCATMRPTAPLAAFWTSTSPSARSRLSSRLAALNGMATSWAAALSGMPSGAGTRLRASATNHSAQTPKAPAITRSPIARLSTPSPSASTTPTASVPLAAGSSGLNP